MMLVQYHTRRPHFSDSSTSPEISQIQRQVPDTLFVRRVQLDGFPQQNDGRLRISRRLERYCGII